MPDDRLLAARRGVGVRAPERRRLRPPGAGRDPLSRAVGAGARLLRASRPARRPRRSPRSRRRARRAFCTRSWPSRSGSSSPSIEDVRCSALMKAAGDRRAAGADAHRQSRALLDAARALRASFEQGGKLLAIGNGGSATDAMDVVADFRAAAARRRQGPAGDRPDGGLRDPDRDRERHRHRRDLLAAGDRLRAAWRRAARALHLGQLPQRDRCARPGAPPGPHDDRAGRLRRRARGIGAPGRPRA